MKGFDFLKKLLTLLFATVILFSASPAFAQHCDVKKGDSMWRIAKRYNVEFRRVLELNRHYKNPHMIHPRDEVELPDGTTGSETTQGGQGDTQKENDKTADQNNSEQAKEVLKLVNTERAKQKLEALTLDTKLNNVAQLKAEDMRNNNYFDHNSPKYGSPFDLMRSQGVSYRSAGENIAAGQTSAEAVMRDWMNSSGHRANIMNPNYTKLGVGYCTGGSMRTYWVQEFTS